MIEKDNIQELFSKAFENHASPVRPDLWTGVQAKMAAAGASGGAVAAKGISALAKWLIGTAAVTTVGVTAYVVMNTNEADKPAQTIITATNGNVPAENKIESTQGGSANTININQGDDNNTISDRTNLVSQDQTPITFEKKDPNVNDLNSLFVQRSIDGDREISSPLSSGSGQGYSSTSSSSATPTESGSETPKGVTIKESENPTTNNEIVETKKVPAAKIEVPNIFTPNGDRTNDFCEFVAIENVKMVEVTILDADGKTVYKSNELDFKWDGTIFGGEPARIGIYTCLISYVDLGDVAKNKTAYIYLQR